MTKKSFFHMTPLQFTNFMFIIEETVFAILRISVVTNQLVRDSGRSEETISRLEKCEMFRLLI